MPVPERTLERLSRLIAPGAAVLDVGCHDGGLLADLSARADGLHLAGLDLDREAVAAAGERLPAADLRVGSAESLPWPDGAFDLVTCFDVLEHLPDAIRADALAETRRVLRPGGHLALQTPHRGRFEMLDAQNLRHRFPGLYARLLRRGVRDRAYAEHQEVVWHRHFTRDELLSLSGPGWTLVHEAYPGLLVLPLADLLSWPFHRLRRTSHPVARALQRALTWDANRDYGRSRGYEVLLTLERAY